MSGSTLDEEYGPLEVHQGILLEGFTPDEILELPDDELAELVLTGRPLTFTAGSAQVLGQFSIRNNRLVLEMAHIEGGGEGVLPALWRLAERYARRRGLAGTEWVVHAVRCANPNPKLRRILELRGFELREVDGVGEAFYYLRQFRG